jgi:hypothetical protein
MQSFHYSCQILIKLEYSRRFTKNTQISNFIKIRPVGAELFHADGRTDMTKLMVAFRDFVNASKNEPFPTTAVQQWQNVDAVGCRTFFSGTFVFDILQISSGCTAPTFTPVTTRPPFIVTIHQFLIYRLFKSLYFLFF